MTLRRAPRSKAETERRIINALRIAGKPLTCVTMTQRGVGTYDAVRAGVRDLEAEGLLMTEGKSPKRGAPWRWKLTEKAIARSDQTLGCAHEDGS